MKSSPVKLLLLPIMITGLLLVLSAVNPVTFAGSEREASDDVLEQLPAYREWRATVAAPVDQDGDGIISETERESAIASARLEQISVEAA